MHVVIFILAAHFIGDFICQSNWQAKNKSSRLDALTQHCICYTLVLVILFIQWLPVILPWIIFNGMAHFLTDFFTSRINKKLWESGNVHNFFVGIGADQLIHYITLLVSWGLFT